MTLWSDLFNHRHMLSRVFYGAPGTQTITAPAGAAYIRVSLVGAGGWDSNAGVTPVAGGSFGYGAGFSRVKTTCAPGDQFTLQVGDVAHTHVAGDALGDSICTAVTGSTVICKGQRGSSTAAGASGSGVGDTKRTGGAPAPGVNGGASAGDDADTFPLGFGGRGSQQLRAAAPGGGGVQKFRAYIDGAADYAVYIDYPPGNGRICVEFFDQDPAIVWPGY